MTLQQLFLFVIFCAGIGHTILAAKWPPEVEFCHRSNPEFSKCVGEQMQNALGAFKNGNSEVGIPPIDPFVIPELKIIGQPGQSLTLNQTYKEFTAYGISATKIEDPNFDIKTKEKCYWTFNAITPSVSIEANYEFKGQVMMIPINAHGKCHVIMTNLNNHHEAWCEHYMKNGKTHLRITKYTMNMKIDGANYEFPNAIPENKQLSDQLNVLINENWKDIFNEIKPGFEDILASMHIQTVNNVFSKFSEEELYPE